MTRPDTSITTTVTPSSPDRPPTIWPSVPYPDPQAAIDFLVQTFGFEPTALIPGEQPGSYAGPIRERCLQSWGSGIAAAPLAVDHPGASS